MSKEKKGGERKGEKRKGGKNKGMKLDPPEQVLQLNYLISILRQLKILFGTMYCLFIVWKVFALIVDK